MQFGCPSFQKKLCAIIFETNVLVIYLCFKTYFVIDHHHKCNQEIRIPFFCSFRVHNAKTNSCDIISIGISFIQMFLDKIKKHSHKGRGRSDVENLHCDSSFYIPKDRLQFFSLKMYKLPLITNY